MGMKKFALRGMIALAVAIALCILFSGTIRTLTTPKVKYAPVKTGKFEKVTELKGKIAFPEEEEIRLSVPEGMTVTVTRVHAAAGQKIKKGEKLISAEVTDAEKTLATLQQEYDTAQGTLESWERKNGGIRLTNGEKQWMEAYDNAREKEREERNARISVMEQLAPGAELPETLPEDAGDELKTAWAAWQEARQATEEARSALKALDRFAIADDTWTLLQQKKEAEQKRDNAESQMLTILLLKKQAESITAPHSGYMVRVEVEKGAPLSGDTVLCVITAEKSKPVIRTELSDTKQGIQKGSSIAIYSDSWGWTETKVTATGVTETGRPYADTEYSEDLTYALGSVSSMLKEEIKMRISSRAQESTCLLPASAVRGSGDERYVYIGETESSALTGTRIVVQKSPVTVLAEGPNTVSIAEDLGRSKVLYMEDRTLTEGGTVMLYEE